MSLELTIRETSAGLSSERVTERKKSAEALKTFLTGKAVPQLLNENTAKRSGYSWNNLFEDVHECVLKEIQKYETSKNFESQTKPLIVSLMHMVVAGSNKGKSYIKCDTITNACLFILKSKNCIKAIGDAYLQLLYKYVLSQEFYVGHIPHQTWDELLDVVITSCASRHYQLDYLTRLRVVLLLVQNAQQNCQFVGPLRDALPRLQTHFNNSQTDKKVHEVLIELATVLVSALSVEYRLTMCKFTEAIMPVILQYYDQNSETRKKSQLFKLVAQIVSLHHPEGRLQNEQSSLAYSWDAWNKLLNNILELISCEASSLQKTSESKFRMKDKIVHESHEFYCMAALAYYQVFNRIVEETDEMEAHSSKRHRSSLYNHKTLSDLINDFRQNHVPWLGIIAEYVEKYGTKVTVEENITILNVVEQCIINSVEKLSWQMTEKLSCHVLRSLKKESSQIDINNAFVSLWNACVRNSTLSGPAHKTLHSIIQCLLNLNAIDVQNTRSLTKLYVEGAMPNTSHSANTLCHLLHAHFTQYNNRQNKLQYLEWLLSKEMYEVQVAVVQNLLLRIIVNENTDIGALVQPEQDTLYNILFCRIDKSIMYSEFECNAGNEKSKIEHIKKYDVDTSIEIETSSMLAVRLSDFTEKFKTKKSTFTEYVKFTKIVLCYHSMLFGFTNANVVEIKKSRLYKEMKVALQTLFKFVVDLLKKDTCNQIDYMTEVYKILDEDLSDVVQKEVRSHIDPDLFHCIHKIIHETVVDENEDVSMESDDFDIDSKSARYHGIQLLAAYCRSDVKFRGQLLELILDPKLYNLSKAQDIDCAFRCMMVLTDKSVQKPPIEKMLTLMQFMCKCLFRNSKATENLLKILLLMIEKIWSLNVDTMRDNCCIMINGYLRRCEALYYPANVAALIYQCAATVQVLNARSNSTSKHDYKNAIISGAKVEVHVLRLYCSHLIKDVALNYRDYDVQTLASECTENLFLVNISNENEEVLKDELANRTLTFLHILHSLAQAKSTLTQTIVKAALKAQKEKKLNIKLVRKVLNKITKMTSNEDIDMYLQRNILAILQFWFSCNYELEHLPLSLFGFSDMIFFLDSHFKWLIPTETLWFRNGLIANSEVLRTFAEMSGNSEDAVIESCFCNIVVMCVPFIVAGPLLQTQLHAQNISTCATRLFSELKTFLRNDRWNNLFKSNMGELVLLSASFLADYKNAKIVFGLDVSRPTDYIYYNEEVFLSILKFYTEIINDDVMKFLCENQALAICKMIVKLWDTVSKQNIVELKCLSLYTYIKVIENIKLNSHSDQFVCNFTCDSVLHAIEKTNKSDELKLYVVALKNILNTFLAYKHQIFKDVIKRVVSLLMIKKEEGFVEECEPLLSYLTTNDQTDGFELLSQNNAKKTMCAGNSEFKDSMKYYLNSLSCPSVEILCNMRDFLKANKEFVIKLWSYLNLKGFSEECKTSMLHQMVNGLNGIITSVKNNKIITEACNCLSVIGSYDLKTLVMSAPPNSQTVIDLPPTKNFAIVVLRCLTKMLSDDNTTVVYEVISTLVTLLNYNDGVNALKFCEPEQEMLVPFLTVKSNYAEAKFAINSTKFEAVNDSEFWIAKDNESHYVWISRITTGLLETLASEENYIPNLSIVCQSKPSLCQQILPSLAGLLLYFANKTQIETFARQLNMFLEQIWDKSFDTSSYESSESRPKGQEGVISHDHKLIIKNVLDVVDYVRLQRHHYKNRPEEFDSFNYLRLEYDRVAWAAAMSDNSLAALYYGEMWTVAKNNGVPPNSPEATLKLNGGENIQRIFRKCFTSIGELDAIDGCGSGHLTSEDEKRRHLVNTGQYSDALLMHDIALSYDNAGTVDLQYGVVKSLYNSGMHHLALQYIKALPENEQFNDIKYECLSFLGDWNTLIDSQELEKKAENPNTNMQSLLKALRYSCLKDCLTIQSATIDFDSKLDGPLNTAKVVASKLGRKLNMDNCQSVYKMVCHLQLFSDIEEYFSVRCGNMLMEDLINSWHVDRIPPFQNFRSVEALISQRSLILEHATKSCSTLQSNIANLQLSYAELALTNHRIQLSQRLLAIAKKCHSSSEVNLVEGQVCWARGHKEISLSLLRDVMNEDTQDMKLKATALRQYGNWMAESRSENARDIIDKYLKQSLEVLGRSGHNKIRYRVYGDIAKFADAEYKQVVAYTKSSIFENKVRCMENMKGAASSLRSTQDKLNKDERKALVTNEKLSVLDEAEIKSTLEEKKRFLELAMRYYLLSLQQGEENNLSVFRVISLWLDNPNFEFEQDGSFAEFLKTVPSRKYVPVLPQLAPRLNSSGDAFSNNLNEIIKRCAKEHPHHTLPILFGLKNSDKDLLILNASASINPRERRTSKRQEETRVTAARALVNEIAGTDSNLSKIVEQMERMCDAIISFANYNSKSKDIKQNVPRSEPICKLRNLDAIPIPTITLSIRSNGDYSDFPGIDSFANTFELVGGINCPKKVICKGTDGRLRTLLIKGEDDLRQDAVMQQVFSIVNTLLDLNLVTSKNKLSIRTYKVVAMSRRSGIIEWCEGTMPIGMYLVGAPNYMGAHRRYRPRDISCKAARDQLNKCYEERRSNAQKLAAFQKIMREFKPVFHYFFTENYLDPVTWYERRLAYTKSVATSSMVGYIMGLGDRHVQNILIDKKSAEVVHIDFGIAFDQGKALPTPELIPFRLTQDIVAGFGPSGVEGIFRRCCEKTMQLLRDNQEALLTILEVLLCDPLYSWTISPDEANRKQNLHITPNLAPSASGTNLAERALLAVASKLSGTEGGVAAGVAVPGQVARLIQCARDPVYLSRLYPGWQPYL